MLYKTNNPHGGDIYKDNVFLDYSVNVNPFGTPEGVKKAISDMIDKTDLYPDPFCRELVLEISKYENVEKDCILCGNGASELIYSYFDTVRPKKAVEVAPTFSEYSKVLFNIDCEILRYNLKKDSDFELDEGILDFLADIKPDVLVLCNPNNPTGRLIKSSLMEKILVLTRQNNIKLFVDECFLDFTEKGESLKKYLGEFPNIFILKAFTKNFGMASLRLGYALCKEYELLKRMSEKVQPWNVSGFAQKAGIAALGETDFIEKSRRYIENERKWLSDNLKDLGFWVCPSDANYLLFCGDKNLDTKLSEYGILIRNCSNFCGLGDGWFRVCVRLRKDNERLIRAIKAVSERK